MKAQQLVLCAFVIVTVYSVTKNIKSGFSLTHASRHVTSRRFASRHVAVLKLKVWTLGLYKQYYKMCSEVRPQYAFFETIFIFFVYKNRKNIVNRQCVVNMRKKAIGAVVISEYACNCVSEGGCPPACSLLLYWIGKPVLRILPFIYANWSYNTAIKRFISLFCEKKNGKQFLSNL